MINNETENYSDMYHTFMFNKITMPRFPYFHILLLVLAGPIIVLLVIPDFKTTEEFSTWLDVHRMILMTPLVVCTMLASSLYSTTRYRQIVRRIKHGAINRGVEISEHEVEEIAYRLKYSFIGIIGYAANVYIIFQTMNLLLVSYITYNI